MIDFEEVNTLMSKIELALDCEAYIEVEIERVEVATFGQRYNTYRRGKVDFTLKLGFNRTYTYNNYLTLHVEVEDFKYILENESAQAWFINDYLDGLRYLDGDALFLKELFPQHLTQELPTLDTIKANYEVD
jgi:hypothetical protein